jgi:hypothetical protein
MRWSNQKIVSRPPGVSRNLENGDWFLVVGRCEHLLYDMRSSRRTHGCSGIGIPGTAQAMRSLDLPFHAPYFLQTDGSAHALPRHGGSGFSFRTRRHIVVKAAMYFLN